MLVYAQLLAQQQVRDQQQQILFWLVVLVAVATVLGVGALILLRRLRRTDEPGPTLGFTLADLRELHAQGQLNDAEFEAAKAKMLARTRSDLDQDQAKKASPPSLAPGPAPADPQGPDDDEGIVWDDDATADPGEDVDNPPA